MYTCVDITARKNIGMMTAHIINRGFKVYEMLENKEHPKSKLLYETLDKFMNTIILNL